MLALVASLLLGIAIGLTAGIAIGVWEAHRDERQRQARIERLRRMP